MIKELTLEIAEQFFLNPKSIELSNFTSIVLTP
jgi:hypothetical protein